MEAASADGPSALRQKMLNRAATFTDGARPSPNLARRRSSLLSNLSDAQQSFRSSTDNLLRLGERNETAKLAGSDEPSHWISNPIIFALLPAAAALTHQNGAAFATDILLLVLAAWFMNWIVQTPWDWYHEAQQRQYVDLDSSQYDDTIHEEAEDAEDAIESPERPGTAASDNSRPSTAPAKDAVRAARRELDRQELWAFAACFLSPFLGAYMLHVIRAQLTQGAQDGIVSDLNLTIFILAAEIRPVRRLIRMQRERLVRLQRVVRTDSRENPRPADIRDLSNRLATIEARLEGPVYDANVDVMKVSAEVRQSMQLQLDALNRAVRKYEKRHMAQSIQLEARFQEVDVRLKDTLSLAAAAARTGQRPGIVAITISWVASAANYGLQTSWDVGMYPLRTAVAATATVKSWFFQGKQQSRKRAKGQLNGHSSIPTTPRVQSKFGR